MKFGNKELIVEMAPMGRHYVMRFTKGGELPEVLRGMYTSPVEAYKAAQLYLDTAQKS
jgi:hypothetical protein